MAGEREDLGATQGEQAALKKAQECVEEGVEKAIQSCPSVAVKRG